MTGKSRIKVLCILIILLVSISSCTIQKRRYSGGFNIEFLSPKFLTKLKHKNIENYSKETNNKQQRLNLTAVDTNEINTLEASLNSTYVANISKSVIIHQVVPSTNKPKTQVKTATLNQQIEINSTHNNTPEKKDTKPIPKQRKIAIFTGVSLVLMALVAALTVPPLAELFVSGNRTLTATNVTSNFSEYINALIGWVTIFFLDILVAIGVYKYYKKEKPKLATSTSVLRLIYTAILGAGIIHLLLVTPKSSTLTIYNNINSFNKLWGIGLIVFGIHLIALGILFKNEGGKKWVTTTIKTLLIVAGIGYTLQYAGVLLLANPTAYTKLMESIFLVPMILGELSYAIWKIVKGGKQGLNKKHTN